MGRRGSARRVSVLFLTLASAALGLGTCGNNHEEATPTSTTGAVPRSVEAAPPPTTAAGPLTMQTSLTGAAEVPGPGDGGGSGSATLTVNPAHTELCYEVSVSGIAAADKAHVHRGPPDQAGPVVVDLAPPAEGSSKGCVGANESVVREMVAGPAGFYVNVHNEPYPAGALRGQLVPS